VIDTILHDSPDVVIRRIEMGCLEATGWTQESLAFLDAAIQLLHVRRRSVPVHCPAGTKSLQDTQGIAGSSTTSL